MRLHWPGLFFAACLALPAWALDVPYLSGRVVDNAEILSPTVQQRITQQLKAHESATGNQVAVLTVPSLEGDSVEDFALRVFEEWQLGQRGQDNGVLVIIAPSDRRMRIEVGYGLEGVLTDVTASRIIRDVMTPRFKAGDFDGGVEQGVRTMVQVLSGEAVSLPAPARTSSRPSSSSGDAEFFDGPKLSWPERILMGAFIFGIIGLFTVIGVMTPGGQSWFMYFFLIPFWAMFPIVIVGTNGALYLFAAYLVLFPVTKLYLRSQDWYAKAAKEMRNKGSASIGGFTIRSGGGGGWSSGGGGGGFSGGGGSSGGGGASGSW